MAKLLFPPSRIKNAFGALMGLEAFRLHQELELCFTSASQYFYLLSLLLKDEKLQNWTGVPGCVFVISTL